jgi:hypothetical protein
MRTFVVVLCALVGMTLTVEAKKRPLPAVQNTPAVKAHRAMVKKLAKARKAKKTHRQRVN